MKKQHLVVAILVVVLFFTPLSLPYLFEFSYWAESVWFWIASILVGIGVAIYVFYIFLEIRRRLLSGAEEGKEEQA